MATEGPKSHCFQPLSRASTVELRPADETITYGLLTAATGPIVEFFEVCSQHWVVVFGLGIGGGLVLSLALISLFPVCADTAVYFSVIVLFVGLIGADVILFMKAGLIPAPNWSSLQDLVNHLHVVVPPDAISLLGEAEKNRQQLYTVLGGVVALAIVIFSCLLCYIQKDFKRMAGMLKGASHVVWAMPSLFGFANSILVSVVVMFVLHFLVIIHIYTIVPSEAQPIFDALHVNSTEYFRTAQAAAGTTVLGMFLWIYFFHIALLNCTIAHAVAHWFFKGEDGQQAGCSLAGIIGIPVAVSLQRVCRYHLGSLAKGSLLLALVTLPRLIMEYVNRYMKESTDNHLVKCLLKVARCWFNCLGQYLLFITRYAYAYVAIESEPFCKAAKSTHVLFAEFPVLLLLEQWTSWVLSWVTSIAVPLSLVSAMPLMTYLGLGMGDAFDDAAFAVLALSFLTSRLIMKTYDICITSFLICAVRDTTYCDSENIKGSHLSQDLREAFGLEDSDATVSSAPPPPLASMMPGR